MLQNAGLAPAFFVANTYKCLRGGTSKLPNSRPATSAISALTTTTAVSRPKTTSRSITRFRLRKPTEPGTSRMMPDTRINAPGRLKNLPYALDRTATPSPAKIGIPIQGHFANQDDWCTPEVVNDFEKKMAAGGTRPEIFRYDAQHAFANETSAAYHAASAKAAWERTMAFLAKHL